MKVIKSFGYLGATVFIFVGLLFITFGILYSFRTAFLSGGFLFLGGVTFIRYEKDWEIEKAFLLKSKTKS